MVSALRFQASTKHFFRLAGDDYVDSAKRKAIFIIG